MDPPSTTIDIDLSKKNDIKEIDQTAQASCSKTSAFSIAELMKEDRKPARDQQSSFQNRGTVGSLKGKENHERATSEEKNKPRRHRTAFSEYQIEELEKAFKITQYPGVDFREEIGRRIGLHESRIHVWFQNRRSKHRKTKKVTSRQMKGSTNQMFYEPRMDHNMLMFWASQRPIAPQLLPGNLLMNQAKFDG